MSSESSGEETDIDDESLKVRHLPFLKEKYHRAFRQLDKVAESKASKRGKHQKKRRVASMRVSTRPVPTNIPQWAIDPSYTSSTSTDQVDLDSSSQSLCESPPDM